MMLVEIKDGDHVPLIPFVEIFESNGATEFWQSAPIFANNGFGIDRVIGATGGYLIGMLVATYVVGQLARLRLDQKFLTALPSMLIGTVITFGFGLVWLQQYTGKDWAWTINAGLTPFIVGEVLKIAIAGTSLPIIWRLVNRKNA